MNIFRSFAGNIKINIVSADPAVTLWQINQNGIAIEAVLMKDPLTIEAVIHRQDFKRLKKLCNIHDYRLRVIKLDGLYWTGKRLLERPVLILGLLLVFLMILYLPGRIFFVQVEGYKNIPARVILEKAEQCGIRFGANRAAVRSEKIKNALLESIPQLQWAGVNTAGCVATITVKEKTISDDSSADYNGVTSIVAARDGVIQKCTVTKGNALCTVGQAVKAGQVLVSGYTDCGLTISATASDAEIFALTDRHIRVVSPVISQYRGDQVRSEKKYSVQIGKNLINLFNNSGILDSTCVKISHKQQLSLPGGFPLPIYWIEETRIYYMFNEYNDNEESDFSWVSDYAKSYLNSLMIAGQIVDSTQAGNLAEDIYYFTADYTCSEMIGQVIKEEIIQ